jgi:hypothetical protein
MNKNNDLPEEEKFSDDPEENLRMQNEFLKLKMMAESGAIFGGGENLPPEIENQFLNNILEFEKKHATSKQQRIKDILGNPTFEKEEKLDDKTFKKVYKILKDLLMKHQLQIDFSRERSDRFKYNFITNEFMEHEIPFFFAKGMTSYFSYEEFHPDHELDIRERTNQFLDDFLERKLNPETYYLEDQIAEPDGNIIPRENFMKRFEAMYEATESFEDFSFEIDTIDFELQEGDEEKVSMGFSEGRIIYTIVWPTGQRRVIDGPFKIYFSRTWEVWKIFFFYLAGFNLNKR